MVKPHLWKIILCAVLVGPIAYGLVVSKVPARKMPVSPVTPSLTVDSRAAITDFPARASIPPRKIVDLLADKQSQTLLRIANVQVSMVCDDVVDEVAPELLDPTQQSVWADKSRLEIIEKRVADAALAKVTDYKFVGGVSFSTYVLSRTLTVKTTSMFMNKVGLPERYVAPRSLTKFIRSGKVRGAGVVGLLASGGLLLWDLAEPPEPEPLSPVEIRRAARLFSEGYRSAKQKCEGTLLKWLEKEPSQTLPTAPSTQE